MAIFSSEIAKISISLYLVYVHFFTELSYTIVSGVNSVIRRVHPLSFSFANTVEQAAQFSWKIFYDG